MNANAGPQKSTEKRKITQKNVSAQRLQPGLKQPGLGTPNWEVLHGVAADGVEVNFPILL